MQHIRGDAPRITRRDFLRGALASAILLALPSCVRGNEAAVVSANNGREIPLFLGSKSLSHDPLENMRSDILNLKGLLERLVSTGGRAAPYRDYDFSGCSSTSRVSLEVAEDFLSETNADMDFLTRRWEFAHGLLIDSIKRCRDALGHMGIGTQEIGREFGVDLGQL